MIGSGVSEPALKRLRSEVSSFLPSRTLNDLHRPFNLSERIGKGCEACLAEDANKGRDHYLRADWCVSWQISCNRHRYPLTDLTKAVLVPLVFEGSRQYRVRFVRDVDLIANPFHRDKKYRGGRKVILSSLALCLEQDIYNALKGSAFQSHWCLGTDWDAARTALIELIEFLLTPLRGSSGQLIQLLADDDRVPNFGHGQHPVMVFPSMGALGQRRILECTARLLIDPYQFDHVEQGRTALGQLAISDLFSLLLAHIDSRHLAEWAPRFRLWPDPLMKRIRAAAGVALYTA